MIVSVTGSVLQIFGFIVSFINELYTGDGRQWTFLDFILFFINGVRPQCQASMMVAKKKE